MVEDKKFEELHDQYKPMIFYIMRNLSIYKNEQEFYQIGCIALWEAAQRFNEEKGHFQSYVYAYISGRMKTALTRERRRMDKECQLEQDGNLEDAGESDFIPMLINSVIDDISALLTANQSKWLKAYCLYGKMPADIAKEEGVSVSAVKSWRRDAIAKLKKHFSEEFLSIM
ncbi:sigma-70 family RNA polymerase sigma factor [uncultured Metabacillus sp.]|uniref:sigma-70 family RNA polymerase sigma factor n=1 Tax=uncultured Metabacillus sp. TaxID=2860135 RepID=UPI00262A0721|nr:sigma-70 family RNA polymerase sigma factor [uncultured Metabacillus sp.]